MLKTQQDVHEMMVALGLHLPNEDKPGLKDLKWDLLYDLIDEEVNKELLPALEQLKRLHARRARDDIITEAWAEVIDGIVDSIVVLHNATNQMGVDLEPFWNEVHRTNMAKAGGPKRADGKGLKPPGWKPPRIKEMLRNLLLKGAAVLE